MFSLTSKAARRAAAALTAAVFSTAAVGTEFGDYIAILGGRTVEAARDAVPLELQLARGERLLKQFDGQLDLRRREVAAAEIDLERAEAELARTRARAAECADRLRAACDGAATRATGCGRTAVAVVVVDRGAKARWLEACEAATEAADHRAAAVAAQREAVHTLRTALDGRTHRRAVLGSRLEALRARLTVREQVGTGALAAADAGGFDEAAALFDRVEREIAVDERAGTLAAGAWDQPAAADDADLDAEIERALRAADLTADVGSVW